ncbi:bifunctional alpha/beta hydrolase/OsmC family protein [Rhodovulum adriaticum]|uniref:Putative redox protein n=1 Tax=Rhodovulum adriaticum TaxID=35804 RepID=A0A4R2NUA9_RHOAD|nr:bifunctional alpha/beta hydrolase/OsmC family protein [Rhodovulum adriaticum]MBK1636184.1 osmotically inducible protein C [Rhodovulum adriaticum]TCP25502.1 putative redox protein [Rhodovulum adriaticum]
MEKITFAGHADHELAARLDRPAGTPRAAALFAHCFTCGKDIHAARRIAQRLTSAGFAVLRFDFTGLGHSGGEFENTTFTTNVADLVAAANHMEEMGLPPALLIGHSLGGAAVIKAAAQLPCVRAVATLGAPFDPEHVTTHLAATEPDADGVREVSLGGGTVRIGPDFLDDVASASLANTLDNLKRALLVMHAPRDEIVGIDNATQIFTHAKHPKSFVTLDSADHLVSDRADADYAAGVIAAWASRYLDLAPETAPSDAPEGVVRVAEADPDGFLQDIAAGRHHLQADEPEKVGGTDRGLSPYGLLAAALGACTSMTIRMYARRKEWPLDSVRVDVCHAKIHAEDAEGGDGPSGKIDRFERRICLAGDLDDTQRERLLEIADKCPVHQTLERSSKVVTELV